MNKKTLLKSIIGTVAIYGVLAALLFILRNLFDVLAVYVILCVVFAACSFTAGLLFKGKMNALVWSAGTEIFFVVICATFSGDWDFGAFMRAVWFVCALLLIPFFIAKSLARSIYEGNERPAELETANKKALLKNIIGTVAIYGVLLAFHFILSKMFNLGLGEWLWISIVSLVACSIAAGLLFKGKIYAKVWSAASIIFTSIMCDWHLEFIITIGVPFILIPLLIPFLITKAIFISINEKKELSAQTGTEPPTEE